MPSTTSPFPIRGVIEGFYGTYYTFPERNDLIRFLGKHGFNFYLYGPKNDRQHRMRWWDPYPARILEDFADSIDIAREAGVDFCYAISFGMPVDYGSQHEFDIVRSKLQTFFDHGCRAFAALLDDMPTYYTQEANRTRYRSGAHAHSDFCNRLRDWLVSLDPACRLVLCPTDYFGRPPFTAYLRELGRLLHPDVLVCYSGTAIVAERITYDDALAWKDVVSRPPLIWDNYPANDLQMRPKLHVGPLVGRDPRLPEVCSGYLANLMNQAEASKIPLLTTAEYLHDPAHYDPWGAWERALLQIGGEDGYGPLRRFAENSLASDLNREGAPEMDRLVSAVLDMLEAGDRVGGSLAVTELSRYADVLDESIYYLKNRMDNLALRQNLIPWIEALDEKVWLVKFSLRVLIGVEEGADVRGLLKRLRETHADVRRNPKLVGGTKALTLAELAIERGRRAGKPVKGTRTKQDGSTAEQLTEHGLDSPGYVTERA